MSASTIVQKRLHQQRISHPILETPESVVGWLGAMQAQDYYGVKWSLAMRMTQATDEAIEQALNDGRILRTHIMRPTWHLVLPADIRWIMRLTANRVHAQSAYMNRKLGLHDEVLLQCANVIAQALEGNHHLTRNELGEKLAQAGIHAEGQRLAHIMHYLELELFVCSGARRGKQFTYALLDEHVPQSDFLEHDEALAELAKRYFTAHAPATVQDFSWWSGLTLTDAKLAVEIASSYLQSEHTDEETYYFSAEMPPVANPTEQAFLISTFDEFFVGYKDFAKAISGGFDVPKNLVAEARIMLGDRMVGSWRRTLKKKEVIVEYGLFSPLSSAEEAAIYMAVQRYGDYLGLAASSIRRED